FLILSFDSYFVHTQLTEASIHVLQRSYFIFLLINHQTIPRDCDPFVRTKESFYETFTNNHHFFMIFLFIRATLFTPPNI
ncbi:hypothetical protein CFOL_v3_30338, partial [Cephalotus follicularis]